MVVPRCHVVGGCGRGGEINPISMSKNVVETKFNDLQLK